MVRVGIIGCGYMSKFHCAGYEEAGAQIVHVCDVNPSAAQELGRVYDAQVSTDYRALLDDQRVDLVSVLTFSGTHKEICLAAIAAGKGVVCEKTLTQNPADSQEVASAAAKAGTFFSTAYMKRFFPAAQKAKQLMGEMGRIVSVYARSWQPAGDLWSPPEAPQEGVSNTLRKYGGGTLICGGSHILDLLHWFAGPPTALCGQVFTPEGRDIDAQANAMFWLKDGGIAHFEACWHPLMRIGYERNGWDERFEINTTDGRLDLYTVLWNKSENNAALLVHYDAKTDRSTEYRYPAVSAFNLEMAEMVRRFEAGEPGFPSAWDGYVVDELISGIQQSAKEGSRVTVPYRKCENT